MKIGTVLATGLLAFSVPVFAQAAPSWPCFDNFVKAEGSNRRVRVSMGVAQAFAKKKIFPDVSDLKNSSADSSVVVKLLIGKDGVVRCADAIEGDNNLRLRSEEAAKQWQFKPYLLNNDPVAVETRIEFLFREGKVTVAQPSQ